MHELWSVVVMIQFLLALIAFFYPLNVIIYLMLKEKFDRGKDHEFFSMLKEKNIDVFRFMMFYTGLINKGGIVTMVISIIYIVGEAIW